MIVYRKYQGGGGRERKPRLFRDIDTGDKQWVKDAEELRGESITPEEFIASRNLTFNNVFGKRLFNAITTGWYAAPPTILNFGVKTILGHKRDKIGPLVHNEYWAKDLGGTGNYQYIEKSPYKPTIGDKDMTYYRPKNYDKEEYLNRLMDEFDYAKNEKAPTKSGGFVGKNKDINKVLNVPRMLNWLFSDEEESDKPWDAVETLENGDIKKLSVAELPFNYKNKVVNENPLGYYTVSKHDNYNPNDRYISIYDKWDFRHPWITGTFIKPVETYDRIYYTENPEYNKVVGKVSKLKGIYNKWSSDYHSAQDSAINVLLKHNMEVPEELDYRLDTAADSMAVYRKLLTNAIATKYNTHKYKISNGIYSTPSRQMILNKKR